MPRRLVHLGEEWEVTAGGTGYGAGFVGTGGSPPPITDWSVVFRSPTKGEIRARISEEDPGQASEDELRRVLEERLIIGAINRSRYVWRPAEAIGPETGIEPDRVREILDASDEVIEGPENEKGYRLYTTREHLARTSADVTRRFHAIEQTS